MPTSASSPRHRATATITTANTAASADQRPGPLVVVEAVTGRALLVDLADDPNLVARPQLRLARSRGELEKRGGGRIWSAVDRDDRLAAFRATRFARLRFGGQHLPGEGLPQKPSCFGAHGLPRWLPRRRSRSGTAAECRPCVGWATAVSPRRSPRCRSRPAGRRRCGPPSGRSVRGRQSGNGDAPRRRSVGAATAKIYCCR